MPPPVGIGGPASGMNSGIAGPSPSPSIGSMFGGLPGGSFGSMSGGASGGALAGGIGPAPTGVGSPQSSFTPSSPPTPPMSQNPIAAIAPPGQGLLGPPMPTTGNLPMGSPQRSIIGRMPGPRPMAPMGGAPSPMGGMRRNIQSPHSGRF